MWTAPQLVAKFERFAEFEIPRVAPLYAAMSLQIAREPALLALCQTAQAGQPPPNLLFAAVRRLLADAPELHAQVFDSAAPASSFVAFREFALGHAEAIAALVGSRRVQTNAIGRSAYIALGLDEAWRSGGQRPLWLVEVGTSAGLNLLCDRYRFDFGFAGVLGPEDAAVRMAASIEGRACVPRSVPPIAGRVGVDLDPVDLADHEDCLWLEALVFAEHPDRQATQRIAIDAFLADPPRVLRGDAVDLVAPLLAEAPQDTTPVVLHTSVLYQMDGPTRAAFEQAVSDASHGRALERVGADDHGQDFNELSLATYARGVARTRKLAECDAHGRWIRWTG